MTKNSREMGHSVTWFYCTSNFE